MAVGPGGGESTKLDMISMQVDSGDGSGGCRCQRQVEEDGAGCGVPALRKKLLCCYFVLEER
jgi:hypothetical protein